MTGQAPLPEAFDMMVPSGCEFNAVDGVLTLLGVSSLFFFYPLMTGQAPHPEAFDMMVVLLAASVFLLEQNDLTLMTGQAPRPSDGCAA